MKEQLQIVIGDAVFAHFGEDHEVTADVYDAIVSWMNANHITFYQP